MRKQWTKEELISFEDEIVELYKDCKLPFLFHLSGGNEEQLIEKLIRKQETLGFNIIDKEKEINDED